VKPGAELDGFVIEREIARGAVGIVYLARDKKRVRTVAIKVLAEEFGKTSSTVRERFEAEARTLATIRHPNILPVLAIGEVDDVPYFVMPFVDGESLAHRLRRTGSLPVDEALDIAIAVASALECAHRQSIVHRDVKPENVLIPGDDNTAALLTDFGLHGRLLEGSKLTRKGQIFGTLNYMAPEQVLGAAQSAAVDVFGLGVLLYEMLFETTPWKAQSLPALMHRIVNEPVTFPATPPISDGLRRFLIACLDKEPSRRPVSPQQDLRRLKRRAEPPTLVLPRRPVASRDRTVLEIPAAPAPSPISTAHDRSPHAVILIVGLAALVGSLILAVVRRASPLAQIAIGGGLTAAGVLLGLAVRHWLQQQRLALSEEAGRILSGTRSRDALTRSLAIEVDQLMTRCRTVDERFLGASLSIMIDEFQHAEGFDDRHRALAASVDFLEKLMNRLSPWYVRHEKLIAAAVALLGVVPGLYQIVETLAR
jgi:serine/threonine protein kinase